MQSTLLPIYTGPTAEMGNTVIAALWNAVVDRVLGRTDNMEKALDIIAEQQRNHHDLAKTVLAGQMDDKKWMQDHIEHLTAAVRSPLRAVPAPVGKSCREQELWHGATVPTLKALHEGKEIQISAKPVYDGDNLKRLFVSDGKA